jgi:predicted transcriptional regulator
VSRSLRYLSRREQELLDWLYREGHTTASETYRRTGSNRSHSTVRTQLRVLEHKGYVKRKQRQGVQVYFPAMPKRQARDRAFRHFLQTFFDGSLDAALSFILTRSALSSNGRYATACHRNVHGCRCQHASSDCRRQFDRHTPGARGGRLGRRHARAAFTGTGRRGLVVRTLSAAQSLRCFQKMSTNVGQASRRCGLEARLSFASMG